MSSTPDAQIRPDKISLGISWMRDDSERKSLPILIDFKGFVFLGSPIGIGEDGLQGNLCRIQSD